MASELRKTILEVEDIPSEVIEVPEWGVEVVVRGMDGLARARFLRRATSADGEADYEKFYPELIIACAYDKDGNPAFEGADRDALNQKSGRALERVATVAQRLSGLGGDDIEEAKGNSESSPKNAST
jgi:hypothetical protein